MIPKIIHTVWFSNGFNYPPDVIKCMNSWKDKLPDYKIMHWNATNVDFSNCPYAKEAFEVGKFAFASDYVRLWALFNYGGIYLDSDVEVLKSFNDLLDNKAFAGFEEKKRIATCVLGCEKGNPLFKEFIDDYNGRHFKLGENQYDITPNPVPITQRLVKRGLKFNNKKQLLENITVYPMDFFCPFNPYRRGKDLFTKNTIANHHFSGAWKNKSSKDERLYSLAIQFYTKIFGLKLGPSIYQKSPFKRALGSIISRIKKG
ncbi:glycosyltransferase family 32 protein [Fibrobacter sp.]|uniref:glycosyltransferase family 32 protein n=1 Tax=Fibrobacter sp. TaxID=35828 RepID=UPI003870DD8A